MNKFDVLRTAKERTVVHSSETSLEIIALDIPGITYIPPQAFSCLYGQEGYEHLNKGLYVSQKKAILDDETRAVEKAHHQCSLDDDGTMKGLDISSQRTSQGRRAED